MKLQLKKVFIILMVTNRCMEFDHFKLFVFTQHFQVITLLNDLWGYSMRFLLAAVCILLSFQATQAQPSWTVDPYRIGDVFFCVSKLNLVKDHKSHELQTNIDDKKLSFRITDEKWITFADRGILRGQANILSRSDFGFNAVQFSSDTQIYMSERIITLVSTNPVSTKIHSMDCERF